MINGYAVTFEKTGPPPKVLEISEFAIDETKLESKQVLLRSLGAPVNPSDTAMIAGYFPIPPRPVVLDNTIKKASNIGGNEGAFEVVAIGSEVSQFKTGDYAIIKGFGFGTWRSHALADCDQLIPLPTFLSPEQAATISVNPPTAYGLFTTFISDWQENDWLIQNAGTSQVAQYVTQFAKRAGVKTLSVIRDGRSEEDIKELYELGATKVVSESEFLEEDFIKKLPEISGNGRFRLGLNSVGGPTIARLVASSSYGGTFVTFGAISGDTEVKLDLADFINKRVTVKGFALDDPKLVAEAIGETSRLYAEKKLVMPKDSVKVINLDGKIDGLMQSMTGKGKYILKF